MYTDPGSSSEMMLKKSLIIGSTMLVVGGSILAWVHVSESRRRQATEVYKTRYGAELTEYMQKYDRLSGLPPEDQAVAAGDETPERLAMEQDERLAAHADELAAGEPGAESFGDALYGADWKSRVEKDQRRREWVELAATGSIVVLVLGGAVVGACGVVLSSRALAWLVRWMAQRVGGVWGKRHSHHTEDYSQASPSEAGGWPVVRNEEGRLCVQGPMGDKGMSELSLKPVEEEAEKTVSRRRSVAPVVGHTQIELGPMSPASVGTAPQTGAPSDEAMSTLTELSEQVSAIRQFVACQHNKVEQFQDGWMILRPLCLRIIRCIDNIDDRIEKLSETEAAETHLPDVRDELLFALESSGLEQYMPEVNSQYRGQEKYAEAVKDKQPCKDPQRKGTIARVVRPGYQYFIDEEHAKVVRTAQVKLYG